MTRTFTEREWLCYEYGHLPEAPPYCYCGGRVACPMGSVARFLWERKAARTIRRLRRSAP